MSDRRPAIVVRSLSEQDDAAWEAALRESPHCPWLQWPPWHRCVGKHLGAFEMLGIENSGSLVGGVIGFVTEEGGKRHFRSNPLTAYHGLWLCVGDLRPGRVETLTHDCAEGLVRHLNAEFSTWAIACAPEFTNVRDFESLGCRVNINYTYRLPLADAETMLSTFEKEARRQIKRSEESGLTFEACEATEENLDSFEKLALGIAARQGLDGAMAPVGLFKALAEVICNSGRAKMFLARSPNGDAKKAIISCWDDQRVYGLLGGGDTEPGSGADARFLEWRHFDWLHRAGHREIDLMGANLDRLHSFKKKWNGVLTPYFTITGGRVERPGRLKHLRRGVKGLLRAATG